MGRVIMVWVKRQLWFQNKSWVSGRWSGVGVGDGSLEV